MHENESLQHLPLHQAMIFPQNTKALWLQPPGCCITQHRRCSRCTLGQATHECKRKTFADSNLYIWKSMKTFWFSHCNHESSCNGDGVGYVCSLVQWQSLCIYLNGWGFFSPPPPHPLAVPCYCKYKANIHRLTSLLAINIFAPFFLVRFPVRCICHSVSEWRFHNSKCVINSNDPE